MNAQAVDDIQPVECLRSTIAGGQGRQRNYASEFEALSIVRRWCDACQTTHLFQVRKTASKARVRFSARTRDVLALFFIGEMIAFTMVALAASALAAVR
ncbi:MAG: hypothetical protein ABI779_23200 [Acidobacteriota bacterium]